MLHGFRVSKDPKEILHTLMGTGQGKGGVGRKLKE